MTPEERQLLKQLATDVAKIKNYTTNLGGSLEFRNIIQRTVENIDGNISVKAVLTSAGTFSHTGTKIGFFDVDPVAQQASIADPSGGLTVDAQARSAINSILDVLAAYGLTAW